MGSEMKEGVYVAKGTRVLVRLVTAKPLGSVALSGMQLKTEARIDEFEATITGIYGDHPTSPTRYEFKVKKDDGTELRVPSSSIVAVIEVDESCPICKAKGEEPCDAGLHS
jgi:hypothetical protein